MAVKFSAFTTRTGTLDASTRIVGYDDPAGTKTNVEFTLATLVDNVPNIYNSDGTLSSDRTLSLDGNNLTINYGTGSVFPRLDMGKVTIYPNGENSINPPTTIKTSGNIYFTYGAPYYQGLVWTSFNTGHKYRFCNCIWNYWNFV